jgi:hypothetical protein
MQPEQRFVPPAFPFNADEPYQIESRKINESTVPVPLHEARCAHRTPTRIAPIYFCSTCEKRLSGADMAGGVPRHSLKIGFLCSTCAQKELPDNGNGKKAKKDSGLFRRFLHAGPRAASQHP